MFDQRETVKDMQKYIDRNYEQIKENQRLSIKPFYNTMHTTEYRKYLERKVKEETGGEMDDKLHPMSMVAIGAGVVVFVVVFLYAGVVVDAFIDMIEVTM
jgi:hypothetical protein